MQWGGLFCLKSYGLVQEISSGKFLSRLVVPVAALRFAAWRVGRCWCAGGDSFATITMSAGGEVTGIVLFENDIWTIEGTASGLCIDAEVVDESGSSRQMVLRFSLADDGHVVIESDGGSIRMVN